MIRDVAQTVLGGIWRLMVHTDFPGLNVSIAGVAISFLLIRASISLFQYVAGFRGHSSDYGAVVDDMKNYKRKHPDFLDW